MFQNDYMQMFILYIRSSVYACYLGRGFTREGHSNLLTIHAEHPKSQHICFPFHTSYLSISHTAVVLFARETDKLGGWQRRYKEEIGKKSERGEKSNYANVIERVTVTCSALPFIHHHTTPHVRVYTSWL